MVLEGEIQEEEFPFVIPPFESLKCTTMTLIMGLTSGVNSWVAFQLLPITRIEMIQTKVSSKCKLPHHKVPGSILSMRHLGYIRGIIRNHLTPFKNAVTIDISTTVKNINMKLSTFSIQMCGASSREDGIEAATHVINHLKYIQYILSKIQANPDLSMQCLEWVSDNTRGEPIEKKCMESRQYINLCLNIIRDLEEFTIIKPRHSIPEDIDEEITLFLLGLCDDYLYHGDMMQKLKFALKVPGVIEESLELETVEEAMVNYNFSLGFEVDRSKLNSLINGRNGFYSHYDNALSHHVSVELPYQPASGTSIKHRKNKVPHISFLVYRSGSVTLSGPGRKIMEVSYYLFMETISEIRSYIEYDPNQILT